MAKWVYSFEEGNADMRNLLGGKGANLAEMTNLGLPIPQGFTVTTKRVRTIMRRVSRFLMKSKDRFLTRFPSWKKSRERSSGIRKIRF